jgi:hypothetical protein
VRNFGLLPRSVIGEIALDLLHHCQMRNCSPGYHLKQLFRELLNLDVDRHLTVHDKAKVWMAVAIARNPKITTRALARSIGVAPSTVLRWRRSSEFKKQVELNAQKIASLPGAGKKMSAEDFLCHSEGSLAKNAIAPILDAGLVLPGHVCEWDLPFHIGGTAHVIYRTLAPRRSKRRENQQSQ